MTDAATEVRGSVAIPEAKHRIEPTAQSRIDEALAILEDHKREWVALDVDERIELLESLRDGLVEVAESWVEAAVQAKGMELGTSEEGEEWMAGPGTVLRNITLLITSLQDIRDYGVPQLPKPAFARPDGQVVAPVIPANGWDRVLFQGFSAEIWMQPDVSLDRLADTQAVFYRSPQPKGGIALVLGAGNVASIGPMDALYKLFVEGQVVILKMNPVNEYLGPFIDEAFAPLRERGFMRVIYGGVAEGDYLCNHPLVQEIHITGSDKTHDAIVFGVGEEGERRKRAGERRNTRRLTCELGNVSPIIIVPGPWSSSDLEFQGANIATSVVNNAGFNCTATRVIVQHEQWEKREDLLDSLREAFDAAGDRKPYYPGSEERQRTFLEHHPDAEQIGAKGKGHVPWTLIPHLDPSDADDICFNMESWCGQTSEVALGAASVVDYIDRAVEFCNERIWGTLACSIIVHPKSMKDPEIADAVERAIANLRYGAIAVNHWSGLVYAMVTPTWGAFPGHPVDDIRSGRGVVHNTYMFEKPQKSVLRGPFRVSPKPPWFFTNKRGAEIGRKMTYFNADPSVARLPGLLFAALRG
jgi:acyl-CoA reductase-like NAD-dependent aldehyde dehydrogenase